MNAETHENQIKEVAKFALDRGFTVEEILSDKIVEITKLWYISNKAVYDKLESLTQTEQKQILRIK